MRKAISVLALILALTCSAHAGYMGNDSPAPPPSQPALAVQGPTTDGEMPNGASEGIIQNDASDGIMDNGAAATFAQVLLNLLALS